MRTIHANELASLKFGEGLSYKMSCIIFQSVKFCEKNWNWVFYIYTHITMKPDIQFITGKFQMFLVILSRFWRFNEKQDSWASWRKLCCIHNSIEYTDNENCHSTCKFRVKISKPFKNMRYDGYSRFQLIENVSIWKHGSTYLHTE